ncbi:MAG: class I SAM-dependent methyltransferase [Verrucomicrobia bacterium]|nr:class I SAM-dependent methyltransferase [Verrucomicrobiota bacterium]
MPTNDRLLVERFPRASRYHPDWVMGGFSGAANPLWLTEWLAEVMDLKPGMRVLDLGCGRGLSSVFLCREFDVQVWAVDLWFPASERLERARDAGVADRVFPLHADARSLPFAREFFDAIVSIDSFFYYGTDDTYLANLARFLKPGGQLGIAGAGLIQEFNAGIPDALRAWWTHDMGCLHSALWWRQQWERIGILEVESADTMAEGWRLWLDWLRLIAPENQLEISTIDADRGRSLGYVRAVGRRRGNISLDDPVASLPTQYVKRPLLRESGAGNK